MELVDADLIEDKQYASMGKNPADRVKTLLGKLHSAKISQTRGSVMTKEVELLFNKFVKQVEKNFGNLPKPLEWQSFYVHDLPILLDICEEVREEAIRRGLNRSQIRALQKLKETSSEEYQEQLTTNFH